MYIWNGNNIFEVYNQTKLAERIGTTKVSLNRIFHRKQTCSKLMAYAITKAMNEDKEVSYFFDKVVK